MKKIVGILLIVVGIFLGLYIGGYLMFIQGIIQIIDQIRADTINSSVLAWGIVKVVGASFVGGLITVIFVAPGNNLLFD